ncbi:MAG: MFS transporter [Planctomycetes bacterium]|nr:MFS transporter [Planctomycetota bacterium]
MRIEPPSTPERAAEPRTREAPVGTRGEPRRSGWRFVPPLYFQQGAQYFLVQTATTTFLTKMGAALESIGHVSTLVTLPFQLKALWSPLVELHSTRRAWTIAGQAGVLLGALLLAWAPTSAHWFPATLAAAFLIALAAATHDVAADGFYMLALSEQEQAAFVGVRNACFRVGRIFVTGAVVWWAGVLEERRGAVPAAWRDAFLLGACVYALGLVVCTLLLPRPAADAPRARERGVERGFLASFRDYGLQPRIAAVLLFVFLYRAGESMLAPMLSPFLLKPVLEGGLGLTTQEQGLAYGTFGVLALVLGGLAGGFALARFGFERCLWPMAITMHAPNLLFWWAAHAHPSKPFVFAIVALEQLAYGFGFAAYMVFLLRISRRSNWPTTHYAISTGLMGVAAMLAGYWSGDLAEAVGFEGFFAIVCLAALPGLLVLPFLPRTRAEAERPAA